MAQKPPLSLAGVFVYGHISDDAPGAPGAGALTHQRRADE